MQPASCVAAWSALVLAACMRTACKLPPSQLGARCACVGRPHRPGATALLASPQAIDKRRTASERELHGSLRVLARHLPQEQFEALAEGIAVGACHDACIPLRLFCVPVVGIEAQLWHREGTLTQVLLCWPPAFGAF